MLDPRSLQSTINFEVESSHSVIHRYTGFACEFVRYVVSEFEHSVVFLKDPTTNDVWGFCEYRFGFQVDSDLEVIVLWEDEVDFREFGSWLENPIEEALKVVDALYKRT